MAIIDKQGKIRDVKNVHFPEIVTHGSPEEKTEHRRDEALSKLIV